VDVAREHEHVEGGERPPDLAAPRAPRDEGDGERDLDQTADPHELFPQRQPGGCLAQEVVGRDEVPDAGDEHEQREPPPHERPDVFEHLLDGTAGPRTMRGTIRGWIEPMWSSSAPA